MAKTSIKGHLDSVEEFERVHVPKSHWKGWGSFIGMYAGEHTAGTEFVIGPLFVAHGVTAGGLIWGLLVGNLLAVLSWAFLCAPIATKARITLYYMLEKICGSKLTVIYNVVNALMFCFLAGAMIAVSATAVGIPFHLSMPALNDWLPNSIGWIIAVFIVGAITTVVAMFGYVRVARFASIAAPWMILVFVAAAVAVNWATTHNSASVSGGITIISGGSLRLSAVNETDGTSKATFLDQARVSWLEECACADGRRPGCRWLFQP